MILLLPLLSLSFTVEATPIVAGYFSYWNSEINLEEIAADKLTHLIYAFVTVSNEGTCEAPKEDSPVLAGFKGAQKRFPHLKIMMAVGGWNGSAKFSDIASNPLQRKKFVKSCVNLAKRYGLDGIDIDWEYPVSGGLETNSRSKQDPKNFVLLLSEFRKQLGPQGILSAAVAAYKNDPMYLDVVGMTRYVDWLGIMAYDYYGAFSQTTGHHAGLFGAQYTQASVELYLAKGAQADKLVMGIPFYGHAWSKVVPKNNGLYQTFNGVPPGSDDGTMSYREIQKYLPQSTRFFDEAVKVSWLFDASTGTMVSYEDSQSIKAKAEYVASRGLLGVMIWELGHDSKDGALLHALSQSLQSKHAE